jgi:hypothetical protein
MSKSLAPLTVLHSGGCFGALRSLCRGAMVSSHGQIMAFDESLCSGGPSLAFRGGRVDAQSPNKAGVPTPEQDFDTHKAAFARQGFTQTEMIQLVACGHTVAGVQHRFFPTIVPPSSDPNNLEGNVHLDSTFDKFDNAMYVSIVIDLVLMFADLPSSAKEYIDGTTKNPLVVTPNITMRSDYRIFNSDSNKTMQA